MKRLYIYIICCVALAAPAAGQTVSLKECVAVGIANNLTLDNARIGMQKGRTTLSQSRSRLLPTVIGTFQLTDYLKSPVNVTTGTLLGSDFPEDPTWQTIRSTQYNANAGIQLSMPLFNYTVFAAIDAAKTVEGISRLTYEKAVEDLTMNISRTYCLAQASLEQKKLLEKNIKRMEELCEITDALYRQGVVMEVDLSRVRINMQNLEAQRSQYQTLYKQQLNLLRFLMNVGADYPLDVERMPGNITPVQTFGVSDGLPELRLAEKQKELAEKRIKVTRVGYVPSISFTGYAGGIGYQEKFHRFFNDKSATDNWFGNCFIGLTVKIPIFEANARKLQARQYKHDARQAANNIELKRRQVSESYDNAMLQLNHNMQVFRTQTGSYRQAEAVYDVTEEQYKEGVASMSDLLQDEMQLRTAQAACVQAHCQYNIAELELLRLSGNLGLLTE